MVVSLKDGMFTNANVLFKTKFVDGMSTVTRTALSQSDANLPQKGQDKARQKDKRNKQLISWSANHAAKIVSCSLSFKVSYYPEKSDMRA